MSWFASRTLKELYIICFLHKKVNILNNSQSLLNIVNYHNLFRVITFVAHIAGFLFLDLYLSNPILFGSIMTSSFVWNQILLLCLFHKVLKFWEVSLAFAKEINRNSESPCIVTEEVYASTRKGNEHVIPA